MVKIPVPEVVDDDETASEPEPESDAERGRSKPIPASSSSSASASVLARAATTPTKATALGKRKLEDVPLVEKVVWTDEEAENEELERQRARAKRRSTATGKDKGKDKGKAKLGGAAKDTGGPGESSSKRRRRSTSRHLASGIKSLGEDSAPEDHAQVAMPDYLRDRRREFDKGREKLRIAGLRLPPDYTDIYFSDDDGLVGGDGSRRRLEKRPKFDTSVKPSRPSAEVELEYSGGLIPGCIARYLRDYQIAGVKFLHELFVYQKGGILGDDMGLGKTVQVAAFLTAAFGKTGDSRDKKRLRKMKNAGRWYPRVLIVCPGSLLENWKQELTRWGWWNIEVFHGPEKEGVLQTARSGRLEIMLTTYQTYKGHRDHINAVSWDVVVADECHCLKDRRSENTKAMNEVNALCRIGLTGTAIQNKYEELWTLLNWTNPGRFGTFAEWRQSISIPLATGQSHDATLHELSVARRTAKKLVNNLLPEFLLRRMKTLIADQLPKKSDKVVFCPMTDRQREAYENFLASEQVTLVREVHDECECGSRKKRGWCCGAKHSDGRTWRSLVFPSITALQKLACHLMLLIPTSGETTEKQKSALSMLKECMPKDWETLYRQRDSPLNLADPSFCGKWKVLRKLLKFWHDNGDKVLVFSHSVRLLRILQYLFHNTSYSVSYLDGSLGYEDRQRVVDDFNSDPSQFAFLISTKAGGVGLNITSANKVVIFDPHWNPAYDLQAQDRAYRIGQVRDVDVFRLISSGTIEEIVYARQIYKQQQANIGYNASTERRYFKGVQQDKARKGEIFGLANLFSFRGDQVVLRDIVNKTNIAEAKAGVLLTDIDLAEAVKVGEDDDDDDGSQAVLMKQEGGGSDEDGGLSQLAKFIVAENQEDMVAAAKKKKKVAASRAPKSDAIQAILASAGVKYTHENSEVVGSSKVEAQLSRRAEMADSSAAAGGAGAGGSNTAGPSGGGGVDDPLFADSQANRLDSDSDVEYSTTSSSSSSDDEDNLDPDVREGAADRKGKRKALKSLPRSKNRRKRPRLRYNPPAEVRHRQFCTMSKELGFASATEFALVVESWTQEQRRNCLDSFYRRREAKLLSAAAERSRSRSANPTKKEEDEVKKEVKHGDDDEAKVKVEDVEIDDATTESDEEEEEVKVKVKVEAEGGVAAPDHVSIKTEKDKDASPPVKKEQDTQVVKEGPDSDHVVLIDDDETASESESISVVKVEEDKGIPDHISIPDDDDDNNKNEQHSPSECVKADSKPAKPETELAVESKAGGDDEKKMAAASSIFWDDDDSDDLEL